MGLFRRKKPEGEEVKEIKNVIEDRKLPEEMPEESEVEEENIEEDLEEEIKEVKEPVEETPKEEPILETPKEIKPAFAPLFVKLDRFKSVLDSINEIKSIVLTIKNSLIIQKQIEDLRDENRKLLEANVNQIDKKILSLDSEFLKPKGYEEELPHPTFETEDLGGVVSDLKKQIENLKSELKTIS